MKTTETIYKQEFERVEKDLLENLNNECNLLIADVIKPDYVTSGQWVTYKTKERMRAYYSVLDKYNLKEENATLLTTLKERKEMGILGSKRLINLDNCQLRKVNKK